MINHLDGKLIAKHPTHLVIECAGVGYVVHISLFTYTKISDSERCKVYTHLSIKEDAHTLFGFFDEEERQLFRHLISVSGIGANTARMMLSSLSPTEIQQAIVNGNAAVLQNIKGIGAKTALRAIIELKDKLGKASGMVATSTNLSFNKTKEEALVALTTLGFVKNSAEKVIDQIVRRNGDGITVEQLIKEALKAL
ncbi:MAG: Holliday junction branch migration protein RuvA [Bacteroidota bacterium]